MIFPMRTSWRVSTGIASSAAPPTPVGGEYAAGTSRPGIRALDAWLFGRVQHAVAGAPIRIRLWNGVETTGHAAPVGTMVIKDRAALAGLGVHPELYFGERYADGRVEVHGDLVRFLEAAFAVFRRPPGIGWWPIVDRWLQRANSLRLARRNIHHHYDIGNEFYRLWLDDQLVYTCAYYPDGAMSLEAAQIAKMDHVCRKLGLKPGERVLEVGCGWGALALHMARHYGVTVKAYNISHEQVRYAHDRARAEGLGNRVAFIEDDYRNATGMFDAFVSIGMLEHVGLRSYRALGELIDRALPPGRGRGLLHFIGRNQPCPLNPWIRRRVFPGAYPPALREAVGCVLEPWDFSVLDVENLRLHYARTLVEWLQRFTTHEGTVGRMFDDRFVRTWRLYLAASAAAFTAGSLQLFQVLFARGSENDVPWSRAEVYAAGRE